MDRDERPSQDAFYSEVYSCQPIRKQDLDVPLGLFGTGPASHRPLPNDQQR